MRDIAGLAIAEPVAHAERRTGMSRTGTSAVLGLLLLLAACSSATDSVDGGAQRAEEAEAFERASFSQDLGVTLDGPSAVAPGATFSVTATATLFESGGASRTTIALEVAGAGPNGLSPGCISGGDGTMRCIVPQSTDPDEVGVLTSSGRRSAEVTIPLAVDATGDSVSVVATVTSHMNGLDNDPDPANNTATLEIDLTG